MRSEIDRCKASFALGAARSAGGALRGGVDGSSGAAVATDTSADARADAAESDGSGSAGALGSADGYSSACVAEGGGNSHDGGGTISRISIDAIDSQSRANDSQIKGHGSLSHLEQQASLVGNLEKFQLLGPKFCYVEFGAGRGKLLHFVYRAVGEGVEVSGGGP